MKKLFLTLIVLSFFSMLYMDFAIAKEPDRAGIDNQSTTRITNPQTPEEIELWWKKGKTLPLETTAKYPLRKLNIKNDLGINVLIDMSIAVGEDLFGFFRKTGKQLSRERFAKTVFMAKTIILPVAPIEPTPPGDVCLDPIGDYTKPITVKN